MLGIPINRITVKVKRLGGAFGGKELKCNLLTLPAAVAATKLKVPIRCMLDRDEDMLMTAGRHPFLMKYKVGFDDNGRILALEVYMYANAGYSCDFSDFVSKLFKIIFIFPLYKLSYFCRWFRELCSMHKTHTTLRIFELLDTRAKQTYHLTLLSEDLEDLKQCLMLNVS